MVTPKKAFNRYEEWEALIVLFGCLAQERSAVREAYEHFLRTLYAEQDITSPREALALRSARYPLGPKAAAAYRQLCSTIDRFRPQG